jgi:hypothetical protein
MVGKKSLDNIKKNLNTHKLLKLEIPAKLAATPKLGVQHKN